MSGTLFNAFTVQKWKYNQEGKGALFFNPLMLSGKLSARYIVHLYLHFFFFPRPPPRSVTPLLLLFLV